MRYDPRTKILTWFADGVVLTTKSIPTAAGTDFPNDVRVGRLFAVLNATGTTPGTDSIDWWAAGQFSV